ncbi:MAG TPA: enoyl-CoA hydratase/isomerase family protein [Bryobacteraceae bacterium]|nr:enoyl-CoA hydratase/isomerase family protein [Bryobacteraceae bacterium]
MSDLLEVSCENRVLRLYLNRADKRNALNIELCRALLEAFEQARTDPSIGAVLLGANGPTFCAGMDLKEVTEPGIPEETAIHEQLFTIGSHLNKPIVAAIHGPVLAGGLGLVSNAHVAFAAHGSTFGLTEIRIAMWPYVIFRSMVLAIGERRTLELCLTGRMFAAHDALHWGLIHHIVPLQEIEERAMALAVELANNSPEAIARGLDFVRRSRELSWNDAGDLARSLREATFASADFLEGVNAFREKRHPSWPSLKI